MTFQEKIIRAVQKIPKGKVACYGQIALLCGKPRGARAVGWVLRRLENEELKNFPWWRVVNQKGEISIKNNWKANKEMQKALLKKERVRISEDLKVDLKQHKHNFNLIF